jgi:hypothetical protein
MARNSKAPDDFTEPDDITEYGLDADPHEDKIHANYEYGDDPNYDPTEHMTKEELDELAREAEVSQQEYEAEKGTPLERGVEEVIDGPQSSPPESPPVVRPKTATCFQLSCENGASTSPR